MALFSPILASLNAGELSPLLDGRVDFEKYPKGLTLCENFLPMIQGPLTRRPGTKYVAEVKNSSNRTALLRFEFSTTQAYIIEIGDLYMRFYKDAGQVTNTAQNITGITKANPAVVTYSGSDTYSNGDHVIISGVAGMTEVNGLRFTVANVNTGANTFELSGINSTSYGTYTSGGTVAEVYELTTTYAQADLFDSYGALRLKFAQSADVLYVAHPSYAPRKISRTGHTSWTIADITFVDGPYLPTNATTTTLTPSAASGAGITITASSTTGINGGTGFASSDVGRFIRIKHSNKWGYAKIVGYTSTTVVTADVKVDFGAATAQTDWRMGVWGGANGYPACVTFYGDRLYWGGSSGSPQRIDGSNVGDYENMAPTSFAAGSTTDNTVIADDDGVGFSLGGDDVQVIKAILGGSQGINVLTVGGEWLCRPSNQNEAITPTNIRATQSTGWGCSEAAPLRADKANLFVQRDRHTVRELAYVFADDEFKAPDMTVIAEHITRPGITQMVMQKSPQAIVWMVRTDGYLIGFTYDREQQVTAWSRHSLGGEYSGGIAVVESLAVVPDATSAADQLWLIVKRTINGATKRYVEYMTPIWNNQLTKNDSFFVDCGLSYSGSAASSFSGLNHLEGQTVDILANGAVKPQGTVASGAVSMASGTATVAAIGLHYVSNAWTEPLEQRINGSSIQGSPKRISKLNIKFWQTLGGKVGPDADHLDTITFRGSSDPMDSSSPLSDDMFEVSWDGTYDDFSKIYIRQDQPLPMTVVSLIPKLWADA